MYFTSLGEQDEVIVSESGLHITQVDVSTFVLSKQNM